MKLPPTPPTATPEARAKAFACLDRPDVREYVASINREYYHWDKLRYRPAPAGLTPELGWHLVKISRAGQRRWLPLQDEFGRPFSYWLPDPALGILHEIDRGGGTILGASEDAAPAIGAMRDRVIISSLMEEAIATSQIEGAVTTRQVAKEMLRTKRKPRNRSEQMILNSYQTIQLLRQRLKEPLTLELLCEVQRYMTQDTLEDPTAAGRLRQAHEEISIVDTRDGEEVYTPPPADRLEERLAKFLAFANDPADPNSFIHPLVKAAILHFWLAYEHPFVDGNGRTARALLYWYMLRQGYWLFEYLTISRAIVEAPMQYYASFLHSEHDDNDLTYSVLFQLRMTRRALAQLHDYLATEQEEQQALAAALRQFPKLNHRQRALLREAARSPSQLFTFLSQQTTHGVAHMTARNDLIELANLGLLVETKLGRQRAFLAADDLLERLTRRGPRSRARKRRSGE